MDLTISNNGTADLIITDLLLSGSSDFSQASDCFSDLIPGNSCTATIAFEPSSAGSQSATFRLESNDPDSPVVTVAIVGNGVSGVTAAIWLTERVDSEGSLG